MLKVLCNVCMARKALTGDPGKILEPQHLLLHQGTLPAAWPSPPLKCLPSSCITVLLDLTPLLLTLVSLAELSPTQQWVESKERKLFSSLTVADAAKGSPKPNFLSPSEHSSTEFPSVPCSGIKQMPEIWSMQCGWKWYLPIKVWTIESLWIGSLPIHQPNEEALQEDRATRWKEPGFLSHHVEGCPLNPCPELLREQETNRVSHCWHQLTQPD